MTDASDQGHGRIRDGIEEARDRAADAYEQARARAADVVESSRDAAREAAHKTAEAVEANPLGVIVGGLALGALVAAVLPRSQREKELLAPVGRRAAAAATAALAAAKDVGRSELDNLGLNKGAAKDQAKSLFQNLGHVAKSAGSAAVQAGRDQVRSA